jgi:hypothetical protein
MSRILLSALSCVLSGAMAQADTVHELKIGTFADGILTATGAKRLVEKMNGVLANSGQQACSGVSFKIVKGPEKYGANIPKSVAEGNFNQFRNSGYSINVVSQILQCGDYVVTQGQSFGGCTSMRSFPITVVPGDSGRRYLLWLHEIGHSQGLPDRCDDRPNGCRSNIGWVMAGVLDARNLKLSAEECRMLDGDQNFPILIQAENVGESTVDELLAQDWNHAMPVPMLLALDDTETARLREILSGEDRSLWANAVLALGLSGTAEDSALLLNVLNAPILAGAEAQEESEIDFGVIDAKLNVPIALGYLANRTLDGSVVGDLGSLADPTGNMQWFQGFSDAEAEQEYSAALSRNVAVGLALSDMTATNSSNIQSRDLFESNFRGANRNSLLEMDESFVEELDNLSQEVSEQGLANVLQTDNLLE